MIPFGIFLVDFKPADTTSSGEGVSNLKGTVWNDKKKKTMIIPIYLLHLRIENKNLTTLKNLNFKIFVQDNSADLQAYELQFHTTEIC